MKEKQIKKMKKISEGLYWIGFIGCLLSTVGNSRMIPFSLFVLSPISGILITISLLLKAHCNKNNKYKILLYCCSVFTFILSITILILIILN